MMVSNIADLLIKEFSEKKIKTSKDYLDKYGRDWYKGIESKPSAIFIDCMAAPEAPLPKLSNLEEIIN